MDNLTHSLVGVVTAELAQLTLKPERQKQVRPWLLLTAFAANNLPDLDFFYTPITSGKLGYLLHHRGYTHTVGASIVLSVIVLLTVVAWANFKKVVFNGREKILIYFLAVLGICLHIFLDSLNVYGAHALWPWVNGWWAGDSLYIVEPLLWFSLIPILIFGDYPRFIRVAAGIWVGAGLISVWALSIFPWAVAGTATLFAFFVLAVCRFLPGRKAQFIFPASLGFFIIVLFMSLSAFSKREIREWLGEEFKEEALVELALTPFPANPFCWSLVSLFHASGDYVGRRAVWASFPKLLAAQDCRRGTFQLGYAPNEPVGRSNSARIQWIGEYRRPLQTLSYLAEHHCGISAYLRFSRAPFVVEKEGKVGIGDLRFDIGKRVTFAFEEFPLQPQSCPKHVPDWSPWRTDLF